MELPIYIEGKALGRLEIRAQGLYTLFEAQLPRLEGLRRLYLAGGGERACLGVLQPEGERLVLRRRLSRLEREKLPKTPEYADLGEGSPVLRIPPEPKAEPGPEPKSPRWVPGPDGFLRDPERRLLALPCELRAPQPGLRRERIDGREYLLFRY